MTHSLFIKFIFLGEFMKIVSLLGLLVFANMSWAEPVSQNITSQVGVYLDAPYPKHIHPKKDSGLESIKKHAKKEDVFSAVDIIKLQSPVKSQGRRGTCSIFSATALLEFYLIKNEVYKEPNLSEQWLEYITAAQKGTEGSWSGTNFVSYGNYGFVDESLWQYNPKSWTPYADFLKTATEEDKNYVLAKCANTVDTTSFDGCVIGQKDPRLLKQSDELLSQKTITNPDGSTRDNPFFDIDFLNLRTTAKKNVAPFTISQDYVYEQSEIKDILDSGEALNLDVDFFYGAWNHGKGAGLGLTVNSENWSKGIVTYPHPKSLDFEVSKIEENRAGHSIVIVGYDDDIVIEKTEATKDGKGVKSSTKGVYFFKNSWGSSSFGANFKIGDESFPGYGMISMKYAHEHGTFHKMIFESKD